LKFKIDFACSHDTLEATLIQDTVLPKYIHLIPF
jgi:hypothetical protein